MGITAPRCSAFSTDIRVLIAEEHGAVRRGLRLLLDFEKDIEVIGEVTSGREAVEFARKHKPSTILIDISIPELDGIEATRQILRVLPDTKVLIISSEADEYKVEDALASGAHGYIAKTSSLLEVPDAIREIHKGNSFVRETRAWLRNRQVTR